MFSSLWVKSCLCAATLSASAATTAAAQQSDWSYEATIYLFMPETETSLSTPMGTLDGTLSFSDALENLDFAFMGAFSATDGRWLILADYNYTDLSFSNSTPGPASSGLETSFTTQYLSGYVGYRVYEAPTISVDVAGGFRWFSTDTEFTLLPGAAPGRTTTADDSWTDPVIAARARVRFSDKWSGTGFVDYGGFRSGSETWQVLLTAEYAINNRWLIRGGYRYISFDHEIDGSDFTFDQSGPVLGATYRF
ncbi:MULTISPECIES: outer membrane protein [unclassified Ruegeria]|uniref:outer membrane protein n=2 Tax=Ruegeria TaxID=97050 RepID=UPI00149288F2|nr:MULTISPECIES: porin family protein [unclassified Ruegeria]NOC45875.1 porin family protein [Ruegeria sp. HKCCD7559]